MNKQIFALMKRRYGKAVAAVCLMILVGYLFTANTFTNSWRVNYNYYHSEEFIEDFESYPESYTYWDFETQSELSYKNAEELLEENDTVYFPLFYSHDDDFSKNYSTEESYEWNNRISSTWLFYPAVFLFLFIGFLTFFIDLKTSFNTFLFSSGVSRQTLFTGKILMIGLPCIISYCVGNLAYLAMIYARIPQQYINAPLSVLLSSVLSITILAALLYAIGCFIGILTGNMITGPLTIITFSIFCGGIPGSIANLLFPDKDSADVVFLNSIMQSSLGKDAGRWQGWLLFSLLTIAFLSLGFLAYQKISLDQNGHFLLLTSWRLPIFLSMTLFTSTIIVFGLIDPIYRYTIVSDYTQYDSPHTVIIQIIITVIIITLICWSLVYSSFIKKKFIQWQEKRTGKLA